MFFKIVLNICLKYKYILNLTNKNKVFPINIYRNNRMIPITILYLNHAEI